MEPGTSLTQLHWARATLVAGKAAVQRWTINSSKRDVKLVVGRDPESDWVIDAEGVLPRHLALQWNGDRLWLEPLEDGVALVNGTLLVEPLCVQRTAWVEFGGAVMIVDASAAAPSAAHPTPDATARHICAAEEREVSLSGLSSGPTVIRRGAEPAEPTPKEATDPPPTSEPDSPLNTTVIAPLSRLRPELAGDGVPVAVPEPRLGKPPATQERERTGSSALPPVQTASFGRGLALSVYLAHALAFLARHGLRLALALGATLGVSVVPLSQQQVPPPLQARPLAIAAPNRPSAGLPSQQDRGALLDTAAAAQATSTSARSALPPRPPTPEVALDLRTAAESLVAGRYEQALPAYARLAEATGNPVFETIRQVLERRLRARCEEREAQGGEPCGL